MATHNFTSEKLRSWDTSKLRTLLENAKRKGAEDLVALCEEELAARAPKKRSADYPSGRPGAVVVGYHFVCSKDRGVLAAGPGKFWSGSWVVAESNVRQSLKYGAYLALHEAKVEQSYRQGRIIDYRISDREMVDKSNQGIEFLIEETAQPLQWFGGGSGEKGYKWSDLRGKPSEEDYQ